MLNLFQHPFLGLRGACGIMDPKQVQDDDWDSSKGWLADCLVSNIICTITDLCKKIVACDVTVRLGDYLLRFLRFSIRAFHSLDGIQVSGEL